MSGGQELTDLAPRYQSGWVWPARWIEAAAQAAAEMAIVCHIWPAPLDEVLRPDCPRYRIAREMFMPNPHFSNRRASWRGLGCVAHAL